MTHSFAPAAVRAFWAWLLAAYGVGNTLLFGPSDVVGADHDGWSTYVAAAVSVVAFVAVALARRRTVEEATERTVEEATEVAAPVRA